MKVTGVIKREKKNKQDSGYTCKGEYHPYFILMNGVYSVIFTEILVSNCFVNVNCACSVFSALLNKLCSPQD